MGPVDGRASKPPRWEPQPWREHAACKGMDPDLFFPDRGESIRAAVATCRVCPVRTECGEYALDNAERVGVWGGKSERQRRKIRRRRRAAPAGSKRCASCRETKPVDAFGRQSHRPDGLNAACRECRNAKRREAWIRTASS